MEMFEVGGCIRDEILGVRSKDIDFSVVLSDEDMEAHRTKKGALRDPFLVMDLELQRRGFKIHTRKPEFLTIRGKFPTFNGHRSLLIGADHSGLDADFVLARKESDYTDGRRPDVVEPGTLEDDLRRRDFTMNAIAKAADGTLIDPFNGVEDIERRLIRAVGDVRERFAEDSLRAVRALRFSITKGFTIAPDVKWEMQVESVLHAVRNLSQERIKDELEKMFRHDTLASLRALAAFPLLTDAMLSGRVWLMPTMKER